MKMIKHPFSGRFDEEGLDVGYAYRRKVGQRVKQLREDMGLTQKELGKLTSMSGNAISAIELGRNPIPPERYRAFADALGQDTPAKHKAFGRFLLEYTDPWLFGLIYGDERVANHNLDTIPSRISDPVE